MKFDLVFSLNRLNIRIIKSVRAPQNEKPIKTGKAVVFINRPIIVAIDIVMIVETNPTTLIKLRNNFFLIKFISLGVLII